MLTKIIILFSIYAFAGWIIEVIYCKIVGKKKLKNRGFMHLPILPIYGFGALIGIYLLSSFKDNIILLFLSAALLLSLLEYVASFLLEIIFNLKLWDYKHKKINLHGRVCLENTILFGILALVVVYFINPLLLTLINNIGPTTLNIIALILLIIIAIDLYKTFKSKNKRIKIKT